MTMKKENKETLTAVFIAVTATVFFYLMLFYIGDYIDNLTID